MVDAFFYLVAFDNGLRFPLLHFVVEVLNDYGVALLQLVANSWWIIGVFFFGYKKQSIELCSRLFKDFYSLKRRDGGISFS